MTFLHYMPPFDFSKLGYHRNLFLFTFVTSRLALILPPSEIQCLKKTGSANWTRSRSEWDYNPIRLTRQKRTYILNWLAIKISCWYFRLKCQQVIFLLPTTLQYAKFEKVGIKNANLATLHTHQKKGLRMLMSNWVSFPPSQLSLFSTTALLMLEYDEPKGKHKQL